MKNQIIKLFLIFIFLPSISMAFSVSDTSLILGVWLMANKNVHVQVYSQGEAYWGKVVWMDDDANKKNFKMGGTIVDDLVYNAKTGEYEDGNFYGRGIRLNCKIKQVTDDKLKITVSKGILKQVRYCTRVKPNLKSDM